MARRFGFLPRYSAFVQIGRADTIVVKITLDRMYLVVEEINVASLPPLDAPDVPPRVHFGAQTGGVQRPA
jgi:hypothetical protein